MSSQRQYVGAILKPKPIGAPPPSVLVDPLIKMLSSNSARMKFLSCSSKVGFMCVLDVSEEDSEFLEPDNSTVMTSFMLKIVVISENPYEDLPVESRRRPEIEQQLRYEDYIQNRVWKSSTITGNEQICPPLIDLKFLKTEHDKSLMFLQMLAPKITENKRVLEELISIIIKSKSTPALGILGLGIMLMPNIERSVTLQTFLHFRDGHDFFGNRVTPDVKAHVLKLTVSKIFLLFFQSGIIHTDLHQNNILVYANKSGRINVLIIDFGKVIDIEYYTRNPPPEQMRVSIERLISIKRKKSPTKDDNDFLLDYYNDNTDWKALYSKTPHCINALFELGMDTSKRKHGGSIKLIRTSKNKRFKTKRTISFIKSKKLNRPYKKNGHRKTNKTISHCEV